MSNICSFVMDKIQIDLTTGHVLRVVVDMGSFTQCMWSVEWLGKKGGH